MSLNTEIIKFLKELTRRLEEGELDAETQLKVSEFFMEVQYHKEIDDDVDYNDTLKFVSLGWYIYTHLLNAESAESAESESDLTSSQESAESAESAESGESSD